MQASCDGFIRAKDLTSITGHSRTTIWRLEKKGDFPRRRKLSAGCVGWKRSEVEAWVETREFAA